MAKKKLTRAGLIAYARSFCARPHEYSELYRKTDGKRVGNFIERKIKEELEALFDVKTGSAASGLDLPSLNTDIKVTSADKRQSSAPFANARQKVYGLGYDLLIFVYRREDDRTREVAVFSFDECVLVDKSRTADHTTTKGIRERLERGADRDEIVAYLRTQKIPGGEAECQKIADEVMTLKPELGYVTLTSAPQWRPTYGRIIKLPKTEGIERIV